jgi:hypothetical protein
MNRVSSPNVRELQQRLRASRERLMHSISGVSEEQFKRRPSAEEGQPAPWCIAEVLAHLLYSERLQGERLALAITSPGASIEAVTQEAQDAAARSGRVAPVPQIIHGLLASRREIERLLAAVFAREHGSELALEHPLLGRLTVERIARELVLGHEGEHVEQIDAIRKSLGVPKSEKST